MLQGVAHELAGAEGGGGHGVSLFGLQQGQSGSCGGLHHGGAVGQDAVSGPDGAAQGVLHL